MYTLQEKPLSFLIVLSLSGFSLFSLQNATVRWIVFALIVLALLVFLCQSVIRRKGWLLPSAALVAFLLSTVLSFLYFSVYFSPTDRFRTRNVEIEGTVTSISELYDVNTLEVKCTSVHGKTFSAYRLMLEATPELAGKLDIGDIIVGKVSLIPLEEALDSGERIRSAMADGIHSYGELTACEVVGQRSFPIRKAIESLRLRLREFILRTLGSESGGLFLALFAADRSYLEGKLSLDFRRIGISHLLALSGMHLAILSFFIHRLLSLLHIKKMARTVIVMLFVILYMFFTGFPLSVVRAGVMLLFVSLYYLLALPRDSLTVLCISVLLIVLITPYAILDVSLLLSALATFGILRASEKMERTQKKKEGLIKALVSPLLLSLYLSLFAMVYTTPITILSFDEISLLSPISTFLFAFFIELFVYLGIFGLLIPLWGALPWCLDVLYRGIHWLAKSLSSIPYASISTHFDFLSVMLIGALLLLVLALLVKTKKKWVKLLAVGLCFLTLYTSAWIGTIVSDHTDDVVYFYDQKREMMLLKSEGEILFLDFSSYTKKNARENAKILHDEHITQIEKLVFTSYNAKLPESIESYFGTFLIDTVLLPIAKEEEEIILLDTITQVATKYGVSLFFYDVGDVIDHGEMTMTIHNITSKSDAQHPILSFTYAQEQYLYIASGSLNGTNKKAVTMLQQSSDAVVFGYRGTAYSADHRVFDIYERTTRMVVSSPGVKLEDNARNHFVQNGWIRFYPKRISLIR